MVDWLRLRQKEHGIVYLGKTEVIEAEVQDKLYDISRDPYDFLKNQMGYDSRTIRDYIDMDGVVEDLASNSDYSDLNGYDGSYDEIKIGGDYYVVMRIN